MTLKIVLWPPYTHIHASTYICICTHLIMHTHKHTPNKQILLSNWCLFITSYREPSLSTGSSATLKILEKKKKKRKRCIVAVASQVVGFAMAPSVLTWAEATCVNQTVVNTDQEARAIPAKSLSYAWLCPRVLSHSCACCKAARERTEVPPLCRLSFSLSVEASLGEFPNRSDKIKICLQNIVLTVVWQQEQRKAGLRQRAKLPAQVLLLATKIFSELETLQAE